MVSFTVNTPPLGYHSLCGSCAYLRKSKPDVIDRPFNDSFPPQVNVNTEPCSQQSDILCCCGPLDDLTRPACVHLLASEYWYLWEMFQNIGPDCGLSLVLDVLSIQFQAPESQRQLEPELQSWRRGLETR
jgi:hypothetical protein